MRTRFQPQMNAEASPIDAIKVISTQIEGRTLGSRVIVV